jgi:hypothetical protein
MEILQQHLPKKRTIIPYYVAAAFSLVIISFLTFISLTDFKGHFFQPGILALTHLTVFGWGTMVIMGASNQLMPVIADNKLYSDRIPVVSFVLLLLGTCLLVHSFWNFELGAMIFTGALFILTALILHAVNIFLTSKTARDNNIITDFILTAHLWLIVTALIGITLLLNFRLGFLPADHLHYLKIHASIGMGGWFLLLVIGVSSRLIPMFLLSRKEVKKYLTIAYYLINAGLVLLLVDGMILHSANGHLAYIALIITGVLFYLAYVWNCYKSAIRKKPDAGMKQTFIALGVISLPFVLLLAAVLYTHEAPVSLISAYGYSFFGGFITTLIMGQTFKTLPFIVWMHMAKPGMLAEIQPKDLYKERLVVLQMALYLPGFLLFLTGILLQSKLFMYPGSVLMIMGALLYCSHVLYVVNKIRK